MMQYITDNVFEAVWVGCALLPYMRNMELLRDRIDLEKNISYFALDKNEFFKKEMDIVIYDESKSEKYCIELKFPMNGQYPEQMFAICDDLVVIGGRDQDLRNELEKE